MNRHPRAHGRRSVEGKLRYIKTQMKGTANEHLWGLFLWWTERLVYGTNIEHGPATMRVSDRLRHQEQYLVARAAREPSRVDGMLPWLFRELRALMVQRREQGIHLPGLGTGLPAIRDWFLGARPSIMDFTYAQALAEQERWHQSLIVIKDGRIKTFVGDLYVVHREGAFTTVEVTKKEHLIAIGRALGHCYGNQTGHLGHAVDYAGDYLRRYRMAVIFEGQTPRIGMAMKFDASTSSRKIIGADEVKGTQNRAPRAEFHAPIRSFFRAVLPEQAFLWGEAKSLAETSDYGAVGELQGTYMHLREQIDSRNQYELGAAIEKLRDLPAAMNLLLAAFDEISLVLTGEHRDWRYRSRYDEQLSSDFVAFDNDSIEIVFDPRHRSKLVPEYGREEINFYTREATLAWPDAEEEALLEKAGLDWEYTLEDSRWGDLPDPPHRMEWADRSGSDDWAVATTYYFPDAVVDFLTWVKRYGGFAAWVDRRKDEAQSFLHNIEREYVEVVAERVQEALDGLLEEAQNAVGDDDDDDDDDDDGGYRNVRGRRGKQRRHPEHAAWEAAAWKRLTTGRGLLILNTSDPGGKYRSRIYLVAKKHNKKAWTKLYWSRRLRTHIVVGGLRGTVMPGAGRAARRRRR